MFKTSTADSKSDANKLHHTTTTISREFVGLISRYACSSDWWQIESDKSVSEEDFRAVTVLGLVCMLSESGVAATPSILRLHIFQISKLRTNLKRATRTYSMFNFVP